MNVGEANRVRACLDCGEPGALLWSTTKGENPGRLLRICAACLRKDDWHRFGLVERQPILGEVPTELVNGEWCFPQAEGPVPAAVITYTDEPSPETGDVGWCWWACGGMGCAPTYDDARQAAEDVTSLVDSLRLGCEIAYRREPTQEEGDAHEHRHDQSMGASHGSAECFVPMGSHHGWKCKCGTWVWGGPTVCQRCVDADAVKIALEWKAEADRLRKLFDDAGEGQYNVLNLVESYQRNSMEADERLRAVRKLLEENGCECPCDHHPDERGDDCEVCLACRIGEAVGK